MSKLAARQCKPCEGGVAPLSNEQVDLLLGEIHGDWLLSDDGDKIRRRFNFLGYNRTIGFVNAVAWVANSEGHHPDLRVGYGYCEVRLSTHAIKGLSENDFICAAKFDALLGEQEK